jgi:hypothetical protein
MATTRSMAWVTLPFTDEPAWQRRGIGLYWETFSKVGRDPRDGTGSVTTRRRLRTDNQLPIKDEYRAMISVPVSGSHPERGRASADTRGWGLPSHNDWEVPTLQERLRWQANQFECVCEE